MSQLIHLQVETHLSDLTKCGKHLTSDRLTTRPGKVTCRACIRANHPSNQSLAQTTARQSPNFGDPNYPGSGHLKCGNCGRPYIDHPIGPCPYGSSQ